MQLRARAILVFSVFALIAALGVWLSISPWIVLGLSLVFLSVAAVFIFVYEDFHPELPNANTNTLPSLSVLVPCYNASSSIVQCVQSIQAMEYPLPVEVIVIDDGSKDNSVELVKKIPGVQIIEKGKNSGKANCLNQGLRKAKGELVA